VTSSLSCAGHNDMGLCRVTALDVEWGQPVSQSVSQSLVGLLKGCPTVNPSPTGLSPCLIPGVPGQPGRARQYRG
jgi:hypothetical protein